ncbi:MAG: hypothetical protein NC098_01185 [Lachnoclostridium sp.]|nr:hypothetical protein [Lachnoclostridium sp.]
MKPFVKLTHFLLFVVAALGLVACSGHDEPSAGYDDISSEASCALQFYIDAGSGSSLQSRGTYPDDFEAGEGNENYIDIADDDYSIALFTADNRLIASIDNSAVEIVPLIENDRLRYSLKFEVTADVATTINASGSLKLVVMANWRGNYPAIDATMTLEQLYNRAEAIAYTSLPGPVLSASDKIPMYGVSQFNGVNVRTDHVYLLGSVFMLRALAKIDVYAGPDSWHQIESVHLTRHAVAAAPMPAGVLHQNDYIHYDYDSDFLAAPSFPAAWGNSVFESTAEVELLDNGHGHFTGYVPEFNNRVRRSDDLRARLKVKFVDRHDIDYVDFKYYNDPAPGCAVGEPFDILRNNWYRFSLTKSKYGWVNVEVNIIPYSEVELDPEFGLERDPINGWLVLRYDNGILLGFYDQTDRLYYDSDRQLITFSVEDSHYIRVVDYEGNFAWFFDAEHCTLLKEDKVTPADVEVNPDTHLVVYRNSDGRVMYYLNPYSLVVHNISGVEMVFERLQFTEARKRFRDVDEQTILMFDAVSGTLYDNDENKISLPRDPSNPNRVIIYNRDGSFYCYYNLVSGIFRDINENAISNPFVLSPYDNDYSYE